eukprot:TRINITY_DN5204_c0_g1_i2.p1 TRINITY_DN5204_c0_g1~~TRINITY_DN5204_c0_g1_i2.p1  ORF type:complete len:199 (+),score=14.62 TRINITY_DN5204_c0_g1_i2:70-666(+)
MLRTLVLPQKRCFVKNWDDIRCLYLSMHLKLCLFVYGILTRWWSLSFFRHSQSSASPSLSGPLLVIFLDTFTMKKKTEGYFDVVFGCITGNNDVLSQSGMSFGACVERCNTSPKCTSIEYHDGSQTCHLSTVRRVTTQDAWTSPCYLDDWIYLEKVIDSSKSLLSIAEQEFAASEGTNGAGGNDTVFIVLGYLLQLLF